VTDSKIRIFFALATILKLKTTNLKEISSLDKTFGVVL